MRGKLNVIENKLFVRFFICRWPSLHPRSLLSHLSILPSRQQDVGTDVVSFAMENNQPVPPSLARHSPIRPTVSHLSDNEHATLLFPLAAAAVTHKAAACLAVQS